MEEYIRAKEIGYENALKIKDKEIREIRRRLMENEDEMKLLITEIERQKKAAKENIERLTQLFK